MPAGGGGALHREPLCVLGKSSGKNLSIPPVIHARCPHLSPPSLPLLDQHGSPAQHTCLSLRTANAHLPMGSPPPSPQANSQQNANVISTLLRAGER